MSRSVGLAAAIAILFAAGAHAEVTRVMRSGDTWDLLVRDAGTQR